MFEILITNDGNRFLMNKVKIIILFLPKRSGASLA